jgi:flavin reductase (DIM6/NTAB) family NADH-FMN oxidoreductase RutF
MLFNVDHLAPGIAYKLITSTITPRPIGWVTTLSANGVVNAAPFSFFNGMGGAPPVVALGFARAPDRPLKDTAQNILDQGEFVVNLVSEALAGAMSLTSASLPAGESEVALAGLAVAPSSRIAPPRLADSPVSMECKTHTVVETGPGQVVVIGQVLAFHIADDFVLDAANGYIDTPALGLVARMHGAGWYARSTDLFQLARPEPMTKQVADV